MLPLLPQPKLCVVVHLADRLQELVHVLAATPSDGPTQIGQVICQAGSAPGGDTGVRPGHATW